MLLPSHIALRWSANPFAEKGYKHLAALRPNPPETTRSFSHVNSQAVDKKAG